MPLDKYVAICALLNTSAGLLQGLLGVFRNRKLIQSKVHAVESATQLGCLGSTFSLAGTFDAIFVVGTVFVCVAASSLQASAIRASTTRATLGVTLTGGTFVVFADLPGGAIVLGSAHAIFHNARSGVAALEALTMRVLAAFGAVLLKAVLSILAVFVFAAVWIFGLLVGATREQEAEAEHGEEITHRRATVFLSFE